MESSQLGASKPVEQPKAKETEPKNTENQDSGRKEDQVAASRPSIAVA